METVKMLFYSFSSLIPFWRNGVALKRTGCCEEEGGRLSVSFTSDTSCQLDISRHNHHSFCVDGTQVGVFKVFKESHQIGFGSFLQGHYCRGSKSYVYFESLCNFSNQSLERQFLYQKVGTSLVVSNFL